MLVERGYAFEKELDAPKLFGEALQYIELRIPEARAIALDDHSHLLQTSRCRVKLAVREDIGIRDLEEPLERVRTFLEHCVAELPEEPEDLDVLLMRGVLSGLDPYTTVLSQRSRTEHTIQFRGKLAGIGARIGLRDRRLTLITVYPESPADKAGLRDDDVVLRIDEMSATNILVSDAVERIRGPENTPVVLRIEREGEDEPLDIRVTRGLVTIPSVTTKVLDGGILSAEISHFSQTTPQDFRDRVEEALAEHEIRGVIIDLRRNSGGSMLGSAAIGDLFLSDAVLITTAGRGGRPARGLSPEVRAKPETPLEDQPVIFLTSSRTASGSELLAAGLRYNDRALIVGERSYGKGTVQKTFTLTRATTLKMTVGHFLPNGRPIPGGGLPPDIEFSSFLFGEDRVIPPALRDDSDLPFWLRLPDWAERPSYRTRFRIRVPGEAPKEDDDDAPTEEEEDAPDPAREAAAEVLRRFGNTSASRMLDAASDWLAGEIAKADTALTEKMKERKIDWSTRQNAETSEPQAEILAASGQATGPQLTLELRGKPALAAGEEGTITLALTNDSEEPLYRVRGYVESKERSLNGEPLMFGRVGPGETRTWDIHVEPGEGLRPGRLDVTAHLFDDAGKVAEVGPAFVALESPVRPRLAYRYTLSEIEEETGLRTLRIDVDNRGDRESGLIQASLKHPLNETFEIVTGTGELEALPAGEKGTIEMSLRMLSSVPDDTTLTLYLSDATFEHYVAPEIPLTGSLADRWREAPHIRIEEMAVAPGTGDDPDRHRVVVAVEDSDTLEEVYARVDDDIVAYLTPEPGRRSLRLNLPWTPAEGARRFQIFARDADGLTTIYNTVL